LTVQNAGKPFGGWGSAPDSAGDLRAPPDPIAGEEVALCPPTSLPFRPHSLPPLILLPKSAFASHTY